MWKRNNIYYSLEKLAHFVLKMEVVYRLRKPGQFSLIRVLRKKIEYKQKKFEKINYVF